MVEFPSIFSYAYFTRNKYATRSRGNIPRSKQPITFSSFYLQRFVIRCRCKYDEHVCNDSSIERMIE